MARCTFLHSFQYVYKHRYIYHLWHKIGMLHLLCLLRGPSIIGCRQYARNGGWYCNVCVNTWSIERWTAQYTTNTCSNNIITWEILYSCTFVMGSYLVYCLLCVPLALPLSKCVCAVHWRFCLAQNCKLINMFPFLYTAQLIAYMPVVLLCMLTRLINDHNANFSLCLARSPARPLAYPPSR